MITNKCPNPECEKTYEVAENRVGKQGLCQKCGTQFRVTQTGSSSAHKNTQANARSTLAASASADTVKQLGRFQVRETLGMGAFGTVYRAHDPQLDREVALKVPHRHAVSRSIGICP